MAEEKEESPKGTPSQIHDLENGIFNMVITLTQTLSLNNDPQTARAYVIHYLERLSAGLQMAGEESGDEQHD